MTLRVDPPPPARSLLLRTSAVMGLALAVAAVALVLFVRPYLTSAFQRESAKLLQDQETRARAVARVDADLTESLLRSGVQGAWQGAREAVADAPIELVTEDHEATRGLLEDRLAERQSEAADNLTAVAGEVHRRSESRVRDAQKNVSERNRLGAEEFAADLALRTAALLLALLAVVFLVHGGLLYARVLGPVRRLSDATREVAAGELTTRIPVDGDDEVADLARSFNAMTESLETATSDLRSLNATLEDRVVEKTAALRTALDASTEANRRLEQTMEELRRKERELRQAEKMASLGTLAGGVAHEFNNLLGGILGCAEDARAEEDVAEVRDTLGVIERAARRGSAITANLLRFARPSSGERQELDAGELLRDLAALVGPEAARGGVDVRVECDGAFPVHADPSGLHQVLLNLATNALHAMPDGGTLTLAAELSAEDLRLIVRDTGTGVDPADRDRLFEPFFSTRGPEGTGLGLAVSYGIVQAHDGRIDLESAPGRGSTFTVTLPRAPDDRSTPEQGATT